MFLISISVFLKNLKIIYIRYFLMDILSSNLGENIYLNKKYNIF